MAIDLSFTEEELAVDCGLGYPRAYAKLCRDRSFGPYSHGPPFTFTPYSLQPHQAARAKDLDEMFPIIDPKARPTAKPKIFAGLLWKQLNHLGNAGFDPATFRVDTYGNVLYYYADSASPLAWDVDHWFPYSRGGLTVPSNLRILQWKVCKKKHNKLEFLIPWWDFQEGISINQFLSIFASTNSDFRHRAFSHLFLHSESEELNDSQTVDSHVFPQHFTQLKEQVGLAPAAVVVSRRESFDSSTLKSLDINRQPRSESPILAARRVKTSMYKENENPDIVTNPYQAIVMARDSLRLREETTKMQGEISKLDGEVNELRHKTEEEKVVIQNLELVLIKKRRRTEKCRKLAEAQSSYRAMLEKMIRDAMHQSVIYKQQMRLNEAASSALMARLEAQKAICDSSERELHRKFRQRDELETQIRPDWDQARKRSRMADTLFDEQEEKSILHLRGNEPRTLLEKKSHDASLDEKDAEKTEKTVLCLPGIEERRPPPLHKELRVFLEEEHKASEAGFSPNEGQEREKIEGGGETEECNKAIVTADEKSIEEKLQKLEIVSTGKIYNNIQVPITCEPERDEEDEESRKQRGKGNVEKWLQMLLEDTKESGEQNLEYEGENSRIDELNLICPQKGNKLSRFPESQNPLEVRENEDYIKTQEAIQVKDGGKAKEEIVENEAKHACLLKNPPPYKLVSEKRNPNAVGSVGKGVGSSSSFEGQERGIKSGKERGLVRCESARTFRQTPSSPSIILVAGSNFIKSFSIKSIKKAVKI
ncbi:hypothetical protein LguiB_008273 [Lonicera macranthoides]